MTGKEISIERQSPNSVTSAPAELADTYLDLLKKCLLRFDNGAIFPFSADEKKALDTRMVTLLSKGIMPAPDADTMVSRERLDNIHQCAATVIKEGVPGDFIETGVWRGGSCILMRAALNAYGDRSRNVWVADSFGGFPPPTNKYPSDPWKGRSQDVIGTLNVSLEVTFDEVKERFERYGLLDDRVKFLTGFFEHTLPAAPIDELAILRLDGDLYQSTYEALDALYPKLSVGGYCIVDDYFYTMCSKAVDDYRRKHGIDDPIEAVDWTCVQWRKTR